MKKVYILSFIFLSVQTHALEFRNNYTVVIPNDADKIEVRAAEQFIRYIRSVTGFEPVLAKEKDFDMKKKAVYIGRTAFAKLQKINFSELDAEEWIIRTVNDELIIAGGYPRGTLYGVYEYLEKHAKVSLPDEKTIAASRNTDLTIGEYDLRFKPVIRQRAIHISNASDNPRFKEFNKGYSLSQTYNGMTRFLGGPRPHHTFRDYIKKWPAKAELFSMNAKGERLLPQKGRLRGQICMTNPEARQLTLKQLRVFIQNDRSRAAKGKYPYPCVYDISQEDNAHKCECPGCKALAEKEGSYSAPLLDFINFIAREIRKEYPDVYIRTFAYMYSEKAPKNLVAEKNVIIQLAILGSEFGDSLHFNDTTRPVTHKFNENSRRLLADWSKHAENIAKWDYWIVYPRQVAPLVRVNAIAQDMKYYKSHNVKWLFAEFENPVWMSFFGLTRWLGYKLAENPDADADKMIGHFMKTCYGPAMETMQEYRNHLEDTIAAYDKNISATAPQLLDCFSDGFYAKALALLAKAEKEAAGDKSCLERIALEYPPIYGGILQRWKYLPEMQKKFDFDGLIAKFKESSMKTMDYRIGRNNQFLRKSCIASMNKYIREFKVNSFSVPLPQQFTAGKGKWLDFNVYQLAKFDGEWTDFNDYQAKNKSKIIVSLVPDPDAAYGKAVVYTAKDINDVLINLSDWMRIKYLSRLKVVDHVPDDGKYHWINLGTFKNANHGAVHLELPVRNAIYAGFWRQLEYGKNCTYYISLKRKGNSLYADRLLINEKF